MPLKPLMVSEIFLACEAARDEFVMGKLSTKEYLLKLRELLTN